MIEFKDVSKTYPNGTKGLQHVNLQIEQGEFVAIIGLSGAGKSTLIRTINRMIDITGGQLIVDNTDDSRTALNKLMSRLKNLMVELSVDIIAACHLRKSTTGKPHEEGGRVTMDDLKDSSSIKQLADTIIGLERNQQSDDERETNITKVRVLKNRDFGETGLACALEYDKDSTQLTEISLQDIDDEGAL